jgi:hypothetical protein
MNSIHSGAIRLSRCIAALAACLVLGAPATALGAADLSVNVTASPNAIPLEGPETTDISVTVTNTGSDPAAAVEGSAAFSVEQLSFIGFKSISQGIGIYNGGSQSITFNFGEIPAGKTASVVFVLNDNRSGPGAVWASTTTSTPEVGTKDNTATTPVEVMALVPSVPLLQFGALTLGGAGASQFLTLTNRAAIPVAVGSVLSQGADFSTTDKDCAGATLAVGQSCELSVGFKPTALGTSSGAATIVSNTAKVSPLGIPFAGAGESPRDSQAASLTLAGLPKSIAASRFRKGFSVTITPSEPVALDMTLRGGARKGALASAFELSLFERSLGLAAGAQTVKVKPAGRLLGELRKKFKVRLRIDATDAAGNRSTLVRAIRVKPSKRPRR